MPTKNKTEISGAPGPVQSSTRAGRAMTAARESEHAEAQRKGAKDLNHRALERWEDEGGSGSDPDSVATQPADPRAMVGPRHGQDGRELPPDAPVEAWHTLAIDVTAQHLRTDGTRGLTNNEAARRLKRFGANRLERARGRAG